MEGQPTNDVPALPSSGERNFMVDEGEFRPESEGFWEWSADGMLTINRWSSTCSVSEGLKIVEHMRLKHTILESLRSSKKIMK